MAKYVHAPLRNCVCGHPRGLHPLMSEGRCAEVGCICGGYVEAPPDPLAVAEGGAARAPEPLQQSFRLVSEGKDPCLDALAIICELLEPLTTVEREAVLNYVASRFEVAVRS